jgi:hypothetical protein
MSSDERATKRIKLEDTTVTIHIDIDNDDEYKTQKQQILTKRNIATSHTLNATDTTLNNDLINCVRVCQMTDLEIYFYELDEPMQFISAYNEMKTYLFLKRFLSSKQQDSIFKHNYQLVIDAYTKLVNENKMNDNTIEQQQQHNQEEQLMNTFLQWSKTNGIQHDKVSVQDFVLSGKGLAASEDIDHDEIIITVPRRLLLCVKTALESETIGPIFQQLKHDLNLDEDSIVTLFIMYEKGKSNSIWKPYFDILPQDLSTYPLYFSANALALIEGTPLFLEIMQTKEQLQDFASTVFPLLFEKYPDTFQLDVFTLENLIWTRAVVDTRAFSFREMGCCMLPFVDFVNTYPYPQLESKGSYIAEIDAFQIKTMADCKKGEQLFICYGPYSNRELLQNYGFVTQNNPYDRYFIEFELPEDDTEERRELKSQLLTKFNLSLEHFFRKGRIPSKMLATLRICLLNEEELNTVDDENWTPFQPMDNELQVLNTLQMTVEALIGMLPPVETIDEQETIPLDEQFAIQYQESQRQVLQESLSQIIELTI